MNSKTKLKRVYIPFFLGALFICVTLRAIALSIDYDIKTGYFTDKSIIYPGSLILVSATLFLFTYAFSGTKNQKFVADFSSPATYVPTGALTVAMLFFSALTAVRSRGTGFSFSKILSLQPLTSVTVIQYLSANMLNVILALMVPLSALSVGYFILNACVLERASRARAAFGITNVLFLALYASFLYFDTTLAINAPNKIVDQMAFIFSALFFLYEIRISLGRECWHLYTAFGFAAALLTAYSSIPSLIIYFAKDAVISNNIQENVLSFALFIFIISRLLLSSTLREDKISESAIVLRDAAREREAYIKEKEEAERRAYLELYAEMKKEQTPAESEENASEQSTDADEEEPTQLTLDEALGITVNDEKCDSLEPQDDSVTLENEYTEEYAQESIFDMVADKADIEPEETADPTATEEAEDSIPMPEKEAAGITGEIATKSTEEATNNNQIISSEGNI